MILWITSLEHADVIDETDIEVLIEERFVVETFVVVRVNINSDSMYLIIFSFKFIFSLPNLKLTYICLTHFTHYTTCLAHIIY